MMFEAYKLINNPLEFAGGCIGKTMKIVGLF